MSTSEGPPSGAPMSEEEIRAATVGELPGEALACAVATVFDQVVRSPKRCAALSS